MMMGCFWLFAVVMNVALASEHVNVCASVFHGLQHKMNENHGRSASGSHGTVYPIQVGSSSYAVKVFGAYKDFKHERHVLTRLPTPPAGTRIVLNDRSDSTHGMCCFEDSLGLLPIDECERLMATRPKPVRPRRGHKHKPQSHENPPTFFIVLGRFVQGHTLHVALKGRPLPDVLHAMADIAAGISWLGSEEFVHADVRSDNAMMDRDGKVYLIDLGNAVASGTPYKSGDNVRYTSFFSPPAQLVIGFNPDAEALADERDDVWRLGAVIVDLITGDTPCGPVQEAACVHKRLIVDDDSFQRGEFDFEVVNWGDIDTWDERVRTRFGEVPTALQGLVLSMLQTNVEDRPFANVVKHRLNEIASTLEAHDESEEDEEESRAAEDWL